MSWGFEKGRVYNRRASIHAPFGGQQQGGIITPAKHNLVIIVTGEEGLEHGYHDKWTVDGSFEYFGEGQVGDMKMDKGNLSIASHSVRGKSLLLFTKLKSGLRFDSEMIYEDHKIVRAPDRLENIRDAIVFILRPIEAVFEHVEGVPVGSPQTAKSLDDLRKRAFAASVQKPSKNQVTTSVFERSRDVRDYVVARSLGKCEGCGNDAPFARPNGVPYLEPHHIRRLTDGGPDDPRYVIALCPNCHRRVHSGSDGADYNGTLLEKMKVIEPAAPN
ncbi:hypothetical protein RU07_02240 [Agrobacterium tumefaciens]|uniref:HNH nuclease domain-containing protein n=1 Tax=Agrobacterium tumefaciens TaxID=358 RepID=A0A0D0L5L3_AGRTU|nr:hypothetical protein RU07_02240 [Agrobacterium tumefaciens]